MEVYEKNKCLVISDEIWSDLTLEGHKHIPTQSVNEYAHEHTFAFYAPSKTFNLAGLVGSYHIVYNSYLRDRLMEAEKCSHYNLSLIHIFSKLQDELNDPAIAASYSKLQEAQKKVDAKEEELNGLMEVWEQASAELDAFEESLAK